MERLKDLTNRAHDYAVRNGFYDEPFNIAEKLMLIVSEVSEGLEAYRKNNETGKDTPLYIIEGLERESTLDYAAFEKAFKDTFKDEMADVFIRLFDLCGALDIDIELAIRAKMAFNAMRPYKHGKQF